MKKTVCILLGVLISISAVAKTERGGAKGGDSPFPHGIVMDFPWESVDGCWVSTANENLRVRVGKFELDGQRLVELNIVNGSLRAVGLGSVRNNLVSAFMSAVTETGDRDVFLANLGRYCIVPETEYAECKEAMGISIMRDNRGQSTQEDHVLQRATDENQCQN